MRRTPLTDSPAVQRYRLTKARLLVAMAFAILVFCAVFLVLTRWPGEPVPLLTGEGYGGQGGCYLNWFVDELVVDPGHGVAVVEEYTTDAGPQSRVLPIMWPTGYTARRSGLEVEVFTPAGRVVARTGATYRIQGGYEGPVWRTCAMIEPMLNWTPKPNP